VRFVGGGGAVFGGSLEDQDIIMAENTSCKGFPGAILQKIWFLQRGARQADHFLAEIYCC